jgi:hypothetical protein
MADVPRLAEEREHFGTARLRIPIRPQGVTLQKSVIFIVIHVRISNLTYVSHHLLVPSSFPRAVTKLSTSFFT